MNNAYTIYLSQSCK